MLNMRSTDTLAHTQYLDYRCLIEIDETSTITNSSPTDLEYVILHELGHCYGLDHSSDPTSVMYPTYVGTPFMTMGQVADVITRMTSFAKRIAY